MPGIPQYHSSSRASGSAIHIAAYTSVHSIPTHVLNALKKHERHANVILPHALSELHHHQSTHSHGDEQSPSSQQLWMTCESQHPSSSEHHHLDFILSCTEWHLGTLPVFIVSTVPTSAMTPAFLSPRVTRLAAELHALVPTDRVYSIFAPAPLAKAFAQAWVSRTGVQLEDHPYYAARFSHCTVRTFIDRPFISPPDCVYNLRLAREGDVYQVAALCKGFASESEPFIHDDAGALKEARYLINNQIGWVHEVVKNGVSEIACLVATTRNSGRVATITKVYTSPAWRMRGCAERLVREVSRHYLFSQRKEWVVLYVAHDNPAAAKVYDKVGFLGLCGKPRVEGLDDWIELGFRGARLGHW